MSGPTLWMRRARRELGATLTTVIVLGVGIAADVVVFQCVDRLVLNPLPLPEADRIVVIGSEMPRISQPLQYFEPLSGPEIADILESSRAFDAWLPYDLNSVRMQAGGFPVRLFGAFVWADPLPLLGVQAEIGRGFTAEEVDRGDRVAILSQTAWSRDFSSDPSVVGRTVDLDGTPYLVVGVLPAYASIYGVDVWVPMEVRLRDLPRNRRQFNLMARLPSGSDLEGANTDLGSVASLVEQNWGREDEAYLEWRLQAAGFARTNASVYSDEAVLTMAAALLILALISLNLGNLTLVRGVKARAQTATRLALGSGWRRLALDAVGEAAFLGVGGGVSGLILAALAFTTLNRSLPGILQPLGPPLGLDTTGVFFGIGVTVAASLLLAVAAVVARSGTTPRMVLSGGRGSSRSRRMRTAQRGLVALQLAMGLALASGAGAVGMAVARVLLQDPGFAVDELVSMRISLPGDLYSGEAVPVFFEQLIEGVRSLPGTEIASMATQVAPNTLFSAEIEAEGADPELERQPRLNHTVVGDDYFRTMGIEMVAGRGLDARDRFGGAPVLVVNESAALRLFPDLTEPAAALGRQLRVRGTRFDSGWAEIVGISRDIRNQGQANEPSPEVFTAHRQAGGRYGQMFLVVRARSNPASLVPAIREAVLRLDAQQPVYAIGTPRASLAAQVAPRRVAAFLLLGLAVIAIGLAGLGLHGVLSYMVATRRSELAVRASLGADPARLRRLLFREAGLTMLVGLTAGAVLTAWLGWIMRASLGDAAAWSFPVVGGSALVLALATLIATLKPAIAVARTNPVDALRAAD